MGYLAELRVHWRPLLAALIGLGAGLSFTTTTASIFGPHLLSEFGWSRAEFAAVSSLAILLAISVPIVGRLTDVIGVRRTALIGAITLPLSFVVLSLMKGDIQTYIAVFFVQTFVCSATTATVYSRAVVQHIEKARGLALAIVASGPAISGMIGGPLLSDLIEAQGWRAGYIAVAIFTASFSAIALMLMPSERKDAAPKAKVQRTAADYLLIAKTGAFWMLLGAMLLCNLPQILVLSQLGLLMLENGVATADAAVMFSAFFIGTLVGRLVCGVALDRFAASVVAFIGMGLPAIGLMVLASDMDAPMILTAAVFIIGLSFGAEGDLLGFLVVRQFGVRIYSTVLGLLTASVAVSVTAGALLLSYILQRYDSFVPFLTLCSVTVLIGAFLLLLLRKPAPGAITDAPEAEGDKAAASATP